MKNRAYLFILLFLFIPFLSAQFVKPDQDSGVQTGAGKVRFNWELKKLFLENFNNTSPSITNGDNILTANMIMYDADTETGYAFGNVRFENTKENVVLTGQEGTYFTKKKEIVVKGNPMISMRSSGTVATCDQLHIYTDRNYLVLIGNVVIKSQQSTVKGRRATYFVESGMFIVSGNAEAVQGDTTINAEKLNIQSRSGRIENYTATSNVVLVDRKQNIRVESGKLEYYRSLGYSRISEAPVVTMTDKESNETVLSAETIDLITQNDQVSRYTAVSNVQIIDRKQGYTVQSGRMEYFKEKGYTEITENPVITFKDKSMKAYANRMTRFDKESKASLAGNVRIILQGNRRVTSHWAEYYTENRLLFITGNPVFHDKDSRVSSPVMTVDVDKEALQMQGGGSGDFPFGLR